MAIEMRSFLASDVIYADQAAPGIEEELDREELAAEIEDLPEGQFLPDVEWLGRAGGRGRSAKIPTSEGESSRGRPLTARMIGAAAGAGRVL